MNNSSENIQMLDVPYYRQNNQASCGAAALMMVLKYWDNSFILSKNVEFKIWKKSNTYLFLGGCLQFGIAFSANDFGYKTDIYQEKRFFECYKKFNFIFDFYEKLSSFKIKNIDNISIKYGIEILDVINKSLIQKIPPIVLVNLKPILGENTYHWIVVTGLKENKIFVNDPYIPYNSDLIEKKDYPIDIKIFKKSIATDSHKILRLPPCAILVYK